MCFYLPIIANLQFASALENLQHGKQGTVINTHRLLSANNYAPMLSRQIPLATLVYVERLLNHLIIVKMHCVYTDIKEFLDTVYHILQ